MDIFIGGALGRMGREMAKTAADAGVRVVGGMDIAYQGQASDFPIVTDYAQLRQHADVWIDFSRADGLPQLLAYTVAQRLPLVLCTTGYTEAEQETIAQAAQQIPILRSANMSLGVHVLRQLGAMAARALGPGYDVEIVEKHHRQKLDSPSGTAVMLYDAIRAERAEDAPAVFGRHARDQKRTPGEIGLHAVRGGTVTGEHEIGFYGNAEEILLTHRAESRTLFTEGALRAALFLAGKPAGAYSMQDVVAAMLA